MVAEPLAATSSVQDSTLRSFDGDYEVTVRANPHDVTLPLSARRLLTNLSDPLLRTGNMLIVTAGLNALLGTLFWVAAAHRYSRVNVGTNAAAIAAMMLIAGFAQLNLMSAMVRFVPVAGHGTRRLVAAAYGVSVTMALAFSAVFLLGIHVFAPGLAAFLDHWPVAPWFVLSTCGWCIFVLQDAVLTGLGRPGWVPLENAAFAVSKFLLVVLLFTLLPRYGLLVAWTIAVIVPTVPVNVFIFRRAIPRHVAGAPATDQAPTFAQLSRFLAGDYVASLSWICATSLLPVMVLNRLGARPTATFAIVWAVAVALFAVSSSMGQSLVVQGAKNESQLPSHSRRASVHALRLLVPAVVVLVIAAPWALRIFGPGYALQGTTALRLLVLASLPVLFVTIVVSELRVRRMMLRVAAIMVVLAVIVLALSYLLIPRLGITGVGLAWLCGEGTVALLLWIIRRAQAPASATVRSRAVAATQMAHDHS
jgi:O-antigen/teichoic acid export membrane protein